MEKAYQYPQSYRFWGRTLLFFFIGMCLIFLVMSLINGSLQFALLGAIVFSPFIWLGWYMDTKAKTYFILTNTSLIIRRHHQEITLPFHTITAIENHSRYLTIHARNSQTTILKQLLNYPEFYTLLKERVPNFTRPKHNALPFIVKGQVEMLFFALFGAGILIAGAIMTLIGYGLNSNGLVGFVLFGGMGFPLLIHILLNQPIHHQFTQEHILIKSLLRRKIINATAVQDVRLMEGQMNIRGVEQPIIYITIVLPNNKTLDIYQADINDPIEDLYPILRDAYLSPQTKKLS